MGVDGHVLDRSVPRGLKELVAVAGATVRGRIRGRLIESRLTPNAISLTGFAFVVVAAILVSQRLWVPGGLMFVAGSAMDVLDGRYSRMSGKATPFGAFLDSTLDRAVDGVMLAAVAVVFAEDGDSLGTAAAGAALVSSLLVSYTRARAEGLGLEAEVGLGQRAPRVVLLAIGLFFAELGLLTPVISLLAALAVVTVVQRVRYVRGELRKVTRPSTSTGASPADSRTNAQRPPSASGGHITSG